MHINRKTLIMFFCLFSPVLISAHAASDLAGWGRNNMHGSFIDTACTIAVDSCEQSIDMGVFPWSILFVMGRGSKYFSIDLIDCVLEHSGK